MEQVREPDAVAGGARRRWIAAGASLTVVGLALTSVAALHHYVFGPATGDRGSQWSAVAAPQVQYPVTLPSGYEQPTGLASDSSGGVWFFAQGLADDVPQETLFHWSSAQQPMSRYVIDTSETSLNAGQYTPVIADQAGGAWLGINNHLLFTVPGSSELQVVPLPAVTVGAPDSGLPQLPGMDPGNTAPVESLAIGPGGTILVARTFATELQVVDPATLAVSTIPLPASTAFVGMGASDLASGNSGSLVAAVLYSSSGVHELGQYVDNAWTVSDVPCGAYEATISAGTLAIDGDGCVAAGAISSTSAGTSSAQAPVQLTSVTIQGLPHGPVHAIALDSSAVLTDLGPGIVSADGELQSTAVTLGDFVPGPSSKGDGQATPSPQPVTMTLVAPAAIGSVWFVPDGGGPRLGLVGS